MNREKQCPQCKMKLKWHDNKHPTVCWGDSVPITDDAKKSIWKYWKTKRSRHEASGAKFLLTATEIVQLFEDAGITGDDIGKRSSDYCLARVNDIGDYKMGNCSFKTQRENIQERSLETMVTAQKETMKSVATPQGKYRGLGEAARMSNIDRGTLHYRVKSTRPRWKEYYYDEA